MVWDKELNRSLTPEESGHEGVHLTVNEAVRFMFSKSERIPSEVLTLTPEQTSGPATPDIAEPHF